MLPTCLYERPGRSKKYLPCVEKHCNDLDDALKDIENWMMAVAESDIKDLKKKASFIISTST